MRSDIPPEVRSLARLRHALRKFFADSDTAARDVGLTPQQHQLLLGVAGFTGRGWATIGELAEFLQLRHNTTVGLVDRVAEAGLVQRRPNPENRRQVEVHLTEAGLEAVQALYAHHRRDVYSLRRLFNAHVVGKDGTFVPKGKPRPPAARKRAPRAAE